jgi:hypothetical protein
MPKLKFEVKFFPFLETKDGSDALNVFQIIIIENENIFNVAFEFQPDAEEMAKTLNAALNSLAAKL